MQYALLIYETAERFANRTLGPYAGWRACATTTATPRQRRSPPA